MNEPAVGAALAVSQLALGSTLLAVPGAVIRVAGGPGCPAPPWIARLLGGRLAVQGGALLARQSRPAQRLGMFADLLHGVSMVAVAARSQSCRRLASISAATAFLSAALAGVASR